MTFDFSGLTDAEYLRFNGALPAERIETLIGKAALDVEGAVTHIDEARGCFPSEYFLGRVVSDLETLALSVHGENRIEVRRIVNALEELQAATTQESEYGRDELKKALAVLK